ncbi:MULTISPECIES: hypothetical protein [Streptomyces]|uniref:Integral membrane protein n=1 Tax=Streptomyces ramulosus TaxID=47762 RepID=A0ABW1FEF0_9ACTN
MLAVHSPRSASGALLLVHFVAVLYTTGFVWTLQLMDYPMVARLKGAASAAYMDQHNHMFWRVLAPGLFTAGLTGLVMLIVRPAVVPLAVVVAFLVLMAAIMVLSGAVATPDRNALAQHFDTATHAHLLKVSWIRTLAFTGWSALSGWMIWRLIAEKR